MENHKETERVEITREQAGLLLEADGAVERAREALNNAVRHANGLGRFALSATGVEGRIVGIDNDADPPAMVVEVSEGDEGGV